MFKFKSTLNKINPSSDASSLPVPVKRKKAKLSSFGILIILISAFFTTNLFAVCSPYWGLSTINEAGKVGFVELKLLWTSIDPNEYRNWRVRICYPQGNSNRCTSFLYVGSAPLENNAFLRIYSADIPNNRPFDIILEDSNGDTIDYLSVGNYQVQRDYSCTPYYDWTAPLLNSSHDYHRLPDGTGEWGDAGPGTSGGDTGGGTNDVDSPIISISDITLNKGDVATFTMTIPAAETANVSVDYITVNGSATAGTHYNYSSGTVTIPAGSTSVNFSVTTIANSPDGTVVFYLQLFNAVNGSPANHFPAATLLNGPSIDHFEISHDGAGLTCSPETIIIRACANASCSSVLNSAIDVTLSATNVLGTTSTWSQNPVTIPANSSTGVSVELTHRFADTVTLGAISTPAAANPAICSPSCDLPFSQAGFIVTLANHQSCTTPNLSIQAVEMSNTGNSCAPAYTGNQTVGLIYDYLNPSTGSTVPILSGLNMSATESTSQSRTLNFNASATALLPFQYNDAGQISISVVDGAAAGLTTGSVTTLVTPAQLIVTATETNADCASSDASCSVFKQAGEPFNLTVAAACAAPGNIITPNFETSNGVTLSVNTIAPLIAPANPVTLAVNNIDFVDSDNGAKSLTNQSISEVGVFTISATANNYFGGSVPAGTSVNIGRFKPAYFFLSNLAISNSCGTFTYGGYLDATPGLNRNGQAFTLSGQVEARNTLNGITRNYTGTFLKYGLNALVATGYDSATNTVVNTLNSPALPLTTTFTDNGNGTQSFINPNIHYQFDTLAAPFDLFARMTLQDADTVQQQSATNFDSSTIEQRLGRLLLKDSYGPETEPLEMRLNSEYFDGSNWLVNTTDSCSNFDTTRASFDATTYTDNLNDGETSVTAPIGSTSLTSGVSSLGNGLWFSAPGNNNYGSVKVDFNLTSQGWLRFDWDGDNAIEDINTGTLNFGYYRGSDRVIYWQEQ